MTPRHPKPGSEFETPPRGAFFGHERGLYLWVDGVYSGLRAENERLSARVLTGVNERRQKRFLAIKDGVCESNQNWRGLLLTHQT